MSVYYVFGCHPWCKKIFEERLQHFPGDWRYIDGPDNVYWKEIKKNNPDYLFFLHWSWKVPDEITSQFECILFHPTALPYGRGGTPLQNLIAQGWRDTELSAVRLTSELDAGPVYLHWPLSLEGSSAEELYQRMNRLSAEMILVIINNKIEPQPQKGTAVTFKRRLPEDSELPEDLSLRQTHDYIRMLDAESYPKAFIRYGNLRLELSHAILYSDQVDAQVTITVEEDNA